MYQTCQENLPECGDSRCSIPAAEGERERERERELTLIARLSGLLTSSETRFGREILDDLTNWNTSITPSVFTLSSWAWMQTNVPVRPIPSLQQIKQPKKWFYVTKQMLFLHSILNNKVVQVVDSKCEAQNKISRATVCIETLIFTQGTRTCTLSQPEATTAGLRVVRCSSTHLQMTVMGLLPVLRWTALTDSVIWSTPWEASGRPSSGQPKNWNCVTKKLAMFLSLPNADWVYSMSQWGSQWECVYAYESRKRGYLNTTQVESIMVINKYTKLLLYWSTKYHKIPQLQVQCTSNTAITEKGHRQ